MRLLHGNALDMLASLEAGSVQSCVTSPPYYGLRDYGTAEWIGEDESCDHRTAALGTKTFGNPEFNEGRSSREATKTADYQFRGACDKCGAIRKDDQIGLEGTPDEFVTALVAVFREVRRVLRDDGVLWVNIGDSYAGSGRGPSSSKSVAAATMQGRSAVFVTPNIKAKDLIGIPWMLAFALRADGWYLRQEIIWHKPNPMPESVSDRCTKAHESVFLLAKNRDYFFNAAAIAEPVAQSSVARLSQPDLERQLGSNRVPGKTNGNMKAVGGSETRNKRSVWTIATQPFSEAHFATMPLTLAETCVLASSRIGDTVLDPFNGAGTTGLAALRHSRSYIGVDLNASYLGITRARPATVHGATRAARVGGIVTPLETRVLAAVAALPGVERSALQLQHMHLRDITEIREFKRVFADLIARGLLERRGAGYRLVKQGGSA